MDKHQTRELMLKILELVDVTVQYEALFGNRTPDLNSPDEAWELSQVIFDKQKEIARMLDKQAFTAHIMQNHDHRFTDRMSSDLALTASHRTSGLYKYCIQCEYKPPQNLDQNYRMQRTIAEMLDPKAVREVMVGDSD